jgi:hypothetical protein
MQDEGDNSEDSNTKQPTDKEDSMLLALATQLKKIKKIEMTKPKLDNYKWKLIPPMENQTQRKYTRMVKRRHTIGVHITVYGPDIHLKNTKDFRPCIAAVRSETSYFIVLYLY